MEHGYLIDIGYQIYCAWLQIQSSHPMDAILRPRQSHYIAHLDNKMNYEL